jgi:magnesium-transporting ATPase (P-type)
VRRSIDRDLERQRRSGPRLPASALEHQGHSALHGRFGLIRAVFDLATFAVLLLVFHADQPTFQTFWFVVSLLTELAVVLVLRTHRPAFRSAPSRLLLWTTIAVTVATLAIPFLGPLSSVFGFVPLSVLQIGTVIAIVIGYIAATEGAKAMDASRSGRGDCGTHEGYAAPRSRLCLADSFSDR